MIHKLRGRSLRELRDRLAQLGFAAAERRGLMSGRTLPPDLVPGLLTPWAAIDHGAVRRELPEPQRNAVIASADRLIDGTFDILGLRALSFGTPVNWQLDPLSGRSAPMLHWSRVPFLDFDQVGDHKVTWELNRHQWLITLGQAWVLTGDERYAATAARLLREWLDANPPKLGINWCSSLELAFRVQSWIHGLRLFDGAAALSDVLRRDLVASAAQQIDHVARNLSTWFSPNTHLTGEALALLSAGCAWPELPRAARWRQIGWKILCDELPKQLRPDGVYFEQSAWYQAYTLDFYLLALTWARHADLTIPDGMRGHVSAAARVLRAVTRPDGSIVRFGDDDGGHTLPFVPLAFGDMTDSLWRAAWLLHDDSVRPPTDTGRSTLLWLEGALAFDAMAGPPTSVPQRSGTALRDGGWVTLTEQPGADARRDHWLVLDAGPHGALSNAHSHADALSIDLSVHGTPVLVDPGTGAYVGALRRRYRSTAVHNTVTVDGADSSEQGTSFTWRSAAAAHLVGYGTVAHASFASAFHDGYSRLADPVRHHRTILRFDRHYWIMLDTLAAAATHDLSLTLQCAAGAVLAQRTSQAFDVTVGDALVRVALDPALTGSIEARLISPAYALEVPAPAIVASGRSLASATFCTAIAADDEAGALEVQHLAPNVWRVLHSAGSDLIARPAGATVALGPARFDGTVLAMLGAEDPHTVVAAGAGTLHLAGRAFTLGADDIQVARLAPDGTWTMES